MFSFGDFCLFDNIISLHATDLYNRCLDKSFLRQLRSGDLVGLTQSVSSCRFSALDFSHCTVEHQCWVRVVLACSSGFSHICLGDSSFRLPLEPEFEAVSS